MFTAKLKVSGHRSQRNFIFIFENRLRFLCGVRRLEEVDGGFSGRGAAEEEEAEEEEAEEAKAEEEADSLF